MTITTTSLTKAAGMAAAAAGAIFIAVQIKHPPTDSFLTDTNQWVVRCTAKAAMCALALAGITGRASPCGATSGTPPAPPPPRPPPASRSQSDERPAHDPRG